MKEYDEVKTRGPYRVDANTAPAPAPGDWALKIEAHVNVIVAAMWLNSKEKLTDGAESATHYGFIFLIMSHLHEHRA